MLSRSEHGFNFGLGLAPEIQMEDVDYDLRSHPEGDGIEDAIDQLSILFQHPLHAERC
jgi:hypothetical protein